MYCLKCGREVGADQVFCTGCLEVMEKSPVKPDVVVQLPLRKDPVLKKYTPRKRIRPVEEQLQRVKRRNRWLIAAVCLLTLLSLALGVLSLYCMRRLDAKKFLGQNYSTVETVQ